MMENEERSELLLQKQSMVKTLRRRHWAHFAQKYNLKFFRYTIKGSGRLSPFQCSWLNIIAHKQTKQHRHPQVDEINQAQMNSLAGVLGVIVFYRHGVLPSLVNQQSSWLGNNCV